MYCVFDSVRGEPADYASFPPEGDEREWIGCVPPPPQTSGAQVLVWDLIDSQAVGRWEGSPDPFDRPVTNDEIKQHHRALEEAPIEVFGVLLDCDERSELRMRDALTTWDDRPLQPGMFEVVNGEKIIYWTLGNNQVIPINKPTLESFYNEMLKQRAIRGANLYRRYRQLKAEGCTYRQLIDDAFWLDNP